MQEEEEAEKQRMAEQEVQEESEDERVLRRFDRGFETWLKGKSEQELERVVNLLMKDHELEQDTKAYVECVRSMEHMVKNCTKCRRKGCEKCIFVHALRYVVRWQKPADWWRRTGQSAVMGTVRFLHGQ